MKTDKSYSLLLNAGKPNTLDANAEKALSQGAKEAFAVAIAKDGETLEFKTVEDLWLVLKAAQAIPYCEYASDESYEAAGIIAARLGQSEFPHELFQSALEAEPAAPVPNVDRDRGTEYDIVSYLDSHRFADGCICTSDPREIKP